MQTSFGRLCDIIDAVLFILLLVQKTTSAVRGCTVFVSHPGTKWKRALCDDDSPKLTEIPTDLPSNLIELHVTHQTISLISDRGFEHLTNLEILRIESSEVRHVTRNAFRHLNKLTYLSLQNNSLILGDNGFLTGVLNHLPNLQTLNLDGNSIDNIPNNFFAIQTGSNLQHLSISFGKSNMLNIEPFAFNSLNHIQSLNLSYARIYTLPHETVESFRKMTKLRELYLGGNPWNCDCRLHWLWLWFRQFVNPDFRYSQLYTDSSGQHWVEPTCATPEHMKGKRLFARGLNFAIKSTDFRCSPKLLTASKNFSVSAGGTVNLTCDFYGDPKISVLWYKDGERVRNDTPTGDVLNVDDLSFRSSVIVRPSEIGKIEVWRCAIEPHVAQTSAEFKITVLPTEGMYFSGTFGTRNIWIYSGIGVTILIISLTVLAVCIYYCCDPRNKRDLNFQCFMKNSRPERLTNCDKFVNTIGPISNQSANKGDVDVSMQIRSPIESPVINRNPNPISIPLLHSTSDGGSLPPPRTLTTTSFGTNSNFGHIGGSLIQETATHGENRLLVSCDSPEPKVLLATKLPIGMDVTSLSSIYSFQGATQRNAANVLIGARLANVGGNAASTDGTQVNEVSMHTAAAFASPTAQPSSTSYPPCPVHGAISFEPPCLLETEDDSSEVRDIHPFNRATKSIRNHYRPTGAHKMNDNFSQSVMEQHTGILSDQSEALGSMSRVNKMGDSVDRTDTSRNWMVRDQETHYYTDSSLSRQHNLNTLASGNHSEQFSPKKNSSNASGKCHAGTLDIPGHSRSCQSSKPSYTMRNRMRSKKQGFYFTPTEPKERGNEQYSTSDDAYSMLSPDRYIPTYPVQVNPLIFRTGQKVSGDEARESSEPTPSNRSSSSGSSTPTESSYRTPRKTAQLLPKQQQQQISSCTVHPLRTYKTSKSGQPFAFDRTLKVGYRTTTLPARIRQYDESQYERDCKTNRASVPNFTGSNVELYRARFQKVKQSGPLIKTGSKHKLETDSSSEEND